MLLHPQTGLYSFVHALASSILFSSLHRISLLQEFKNQGTNIKKIIIFIDLI